MIDVCRAVEVVLPVHSSQTSDDSTHTCVIAATDVVGEGHRRNSSIHNMATFYPLANQMFLVHREANRWTLGEVIRKSL